MRKSFVGVLVASAGALLLGTPTQAATVVSGFISTVGFPSSAVITFEEGPGLFIPADAALGYVWTGTGQLRPPPSTFDSAYPAGDNSQWYMSVLAGDQETLTFSPAQFPNGVAAIQMFIGSVDTYNSITFKSGALSETINGTTLLNSVALGNVANSGNRTSNLTNRLFTFSFFANTPVDQIVFDSSINSLEFDDLTAAAGVSRSGGGGVPEPATWTVMIAGFGLLGALLRRRPRVYG